MLTSDRALIVTVSTLTITGTYQSIGCEYGVTRTTTTTFNHATKHMLRLTRTPILALTFAGF
ncbi:hypothetical protein [uncultured Methylophaga sp.]|uniref:hypothetical protein n=1 Tax=uncultured Methylophaga sp. TaxID=285271 RepID=UPI0030DBA6D6